MSKQPQNRSESSDNATPAAGQLVRGLSLIRAVIDAPAPITLGELAERTGLDPSTTLRLTQILMAEGYLVRHESGKRYSAGPRSLSMLSPYHPMNTFRRETSEILQRLRDDIGETVGTVLFLGTERLILEIAQGREALAPFYDTWLKTPLHAAASGKVLLSFLGPKRRRELLGPEPFVAPTTRTLATYTELEKCLSEVHTRGYALSVDDVHMGLTAVAAPFNHDNRALGCIVTVGSSTRLPHSACDAVGHTLRGAARLIAAATPSVRPLAHYVGA